jgi:GH24 family phage-related lysozyme (muramidase)
MISSAVLALCVSNTMVNEGFRHSAYKDRNGMSIGYGYSLTHNPLSLPKSKIRTLYKVGITQNEARNLVSKLCVKMNNDLISRYEWYQTLPKPSQYVMLDLNYNLGAKGLHGFKKTINYIRHNQTTMASIEMLDSRWSRQVLGRARRLSQIMKTQEV